MSDLYQYQIKGSSADGDLFSPKMSLLYERGYISIMFYTDATYTVPVLPSAGAVTFTGSETGDGYGTITNGVVDVTTYLYNRPNFLGPVGFVKATSLGVTGAPFYIATISKYRG